MKRNRVSIMLTDEGLNALDFVCGHYGFSRSVMVEKLVLQSKRKVEDTPQLEKQLADMQALLAQFESTQNHIVGGDCND